MDKDNPLEDLKEVFTAECYEILEAMESQLLEINSTPKEALPELLNAIFRGAHSMKGGAGALGFQNIYTFTHSMEALLEVLRSGQKQPTAEIIDILLEGVDTVRQMIDAASTNAILSEDVGNITLQHIAKILQGDQEDNKKEVITEDNDLAEIWASEDIAQTNNSLIYEIKLVPQQGLFLTGNDPLFIFTQLKELGKVEIQANISSIPSWVQYVAENCYLSWNISLETSEEEEKIREVFEFIEGHAEITITKTELAKSEIKEINSDINPSVSVLSTKEASRDINNILPSEEKSEVKANPSASSRNVVASTIRVDVDRIDIMVNMVGELVIAQSMLLSQIHNLPVDVQHVLEASIMDLSRSTRELQEAVMSVRMQTVQSIFARMSRLARDLSKQLDKPFKLITSGENTEIDRSIIEKLVDPITHMIRNSVDHGLESLEERVKKGKPQEGTVNLSAYHSGGKIFIEIKDDGAGINREKVLEKAKAKGLISNDADLSPEQIDNLIFLPGFSTKEVVSELSGRGVGMDVVDRNIKELGGTVTIYNTPGEGSRFVISLPLTLAILDGMIVALGQEKYIIPIVNIIETISPKAEEIKTIADGNELINLRGEFLPLIYLHKLFNINETKKHPSEALVVIIESSRNKFGLMVDGLIGQQQVVIKNIDHGETIPGISGATILGEGRISLILDVPGIYKMFNQIFKKSTVSLDS